MMFLSLVNLREDIRIAAADAGRTSRGAIPARLLHVCACNHNCTGLNRPSFVWKAKALAYTNGSLVTLTSLSENLVALSVPNFFQMASTILPCVQSIFCCSADGVPSMCLTAIRVFLAAARRPASIPSFQLGLCRASRGFCSISSAV